MIVERLVLTEAPSNVFSINGEPYADEEPVQSANSRNINYKQAVNDLNSGKKATFLQALKDSGHEEASKLLDKLSEKTLINFANSVGTTALSAWKMPFLNIINNSKAQQAILTDKQFTKAYNLLYRMNSNSDLESYINTNNGIIYNTVFYNNVQDDEDAVKLIKYDMWHPDDRTNLVDAIDNNDYGKFIDGNDSKGLTNKKTYTDAIKSFNDLSPKDKEKFFNELQKLLKGKQWE